MVPFLERRNVEAAVAWQTFWRHPPLAPTLSLIFMMTVSSASISHLARSYLVGSSQPSAVTALMNSINPQNRWV